MWSLSIHPFEADYVYDAHILASQSQIEVHQFKREGITMKIEMKIEMITLRSQCGIIANSE